MPYRPTIVATQDGSPTLYAPRFDQHYHSIHGAVQESRHIFIGHALEYRASQIPEGQRLHLLELGLGTGLNALLTAQWAREHRHPIVYTTVEQYPLEPEVYEALSFDVGDIHEATLLLQGIHTAPWEVEVSLSPWFVLRKCRADIQTFVPGHGVDVIYFDAFSPEAQPHLWEASVFATLYAHCRPGAVLTTYCAKGEVRRRLASVGFLVERLPGPPGKREMLRASYPLHLD